VSDIFLSYAREDIAVATLLAPRLEAHGWSVFWDRRIPAGRRFPEVIAQQLEAAKCVIVLWSSAANASDWVLDEAEEARQRNVLAPALIEAVQPPMGFRRIHAADLIGWQGEPTHTGFQRLLEDVAHYVPPKPAAQTPSTPDADAPPDAHVPPAVPENAPVTARPTGPAGGRSHAPDTRPALDRQTGSRASMWKWVGGLAGLILVVALSAFAIDTIRRADGRRANQQDPAGSAGARLGTAEPVARQPPDLPQSPGDKSDSRAAPPPAASSAPSSSARNAPGTLEEATLALVPDATLRQRDAPWRRAASADLLRRLDRMEESIAAAFSALDRTPPADRYPKHSEHSAELRAVLVPASTAIDEAALPGKWLCRSGSVSSSGALVYTYFECTINRTARCLQLRKTTGSSRFAGCLYRLDDETFVHVGSVTGAAGPTDKGRVGGFLTQIRPGRLRLLTAEGPDSFGVLDLKRR
jgi:hypothetical protein